MHGLRVQQPARDWTNLYDFDEPAQTSKATSPKASSSGQAKASRPDRQAVAGVERTVRNIGAEGSKGAAPTAEFPLDQPPGGVQQGHGSAARSKSPITGSETERPFPDHETAPQDTVPVPDLQEGLRHRALPASPETHASSSQEARRGPGGPSRDTQRMQTTRRFGGKLATRLTAILLAVLVVWWAVGTMIEPDHGARVIPTFGFSRMDAIETEVEELCQAIGDASLPSPDPMTSSVRNIQQALKDCRLQSVQTSAIFGTSLARLIKRATASRVCEPGLPATIKDAHKQANGTSVAWQSTCHASRESLGAIRAARVQAKDELEGMERRVYERMVTFKTDGALQRHHGKRAEVKVLLEAARRAETAMVSIVDKICVEQGRWMGLETRSFSLAKEVAAWQRAKVHDRNWNCTVASIESLERHFIPAAFHAYETSEQRDEFTACYGPRST